MKTKVTSREIMALEGLAAIARFYQTQTSIAEQAACEVLRVESKQVEKRNWITDFIYNNQRSDFSAEELVEKLGIKYEKD